MPNIIQFGELEKMIPDLSPLFPVRISVVTLLLGTIQDMPNAGVYQLCVAVRQIIANDIFSWLIATAEFTMVDSKPLGNDDKIAMEAGEEQAQSIIKLIEERLLAQDENFEIKPGIIEIGVLPISGTWVYLNLLEEYVDVNDSDGEQRDNSDTDDDEIPF